MRRALVSVTDKTGVVEFCKGLIECGFEIISTGGTKKVLDDNGVKTIGISEVTGFPEILDGRVKTLQDYLDAQNLDLNNINEDDLRKVYLTKLALGF